MSMMGMSIKNKKDLTLMTAMIKLRIDGYLTQNVYGLLNGFIASVSCYAS